MNKSAQFSLMTTSIVIGALSAGTWRAAADTYVQTDLVSDIPGLADITDSALQNPWGVAHSATSPFWVSNQGTNTATLYSVTGSPAASNVTKVTGVNPPSGNISIPTTGGPPQGPTGQVANTTSSFMVGNGGDGGSAHFIFSNLNGTISAWDTGPKAFTQVTTPGAVYTGLAINPTTGLLYAANDSGSGSINVFDGSFHPMNLGLNAFATPSQVPQGLVPFNVQGINGNVYVTYAPAGRANQQNATAGMGAVAIFDANGKFLRMGAVGGPLAAPWGVTLAPANWGQFSNDLLVGNFSYAASGINAFDPTTGQFEGQIAVNSGTNQTPGGLWFLGFGTGVSNGLPDTLFFTDGIDGETHGLFGAISDVPSAATPIAGALPGMVSVLIGGGLLAWRRKRRQKIPEHPVRARAI